MLAQWNYLKPLIEKKTCERSVVCECSSSVCPFQKDIIFDMDISYAQSIQNDVLAWCLQISWVRERVVVDYFSYIYIYYIYTHQSMPVVLTLPIRCQYQLYPSQSNLNPKPQSSICVSESSTNGIVRFIKALRSHIMSII